MAPIRSRCSGAGWSACFMGAMGVAAAKTKEQSVMRAMRAEGFDGDWETVYASGPHGYSDYPTIRHAAA